MNNRLYVGNLSYEVTSESLRACFSECGEVSDTHLVMDRETGRARGFGFVTMATDADASLALSRLNGVMLDGRPLRVNIAEARTSNGGGSGGGRGSSRGGHRGW